MDRFAAGARPLQEHFELRVPEDLDRREGFLAGSDERRAEELNAALRDPDVRAIWVARGGYGASRLLPHLDAAALVADPKPIIGFSDVTALLCWAAYHGVASVHAPVVTQLAELDPEDARWAVDVVTGAAAGAVLAEGLSASAKLALEGPLVGGNLRLLAHLCGSELAPSLDGALLVVEDIGERPYAIDRDLVQLAAQPGEAGLGRAAALLIGDFTRCDEPGDLGQDPLRTVSAAAERARVPWVRGLPIGHGAVNRAFPFGALAAVEGGALRLR
jgi:muramoyltetrapeptide carboxypeptidase